MRLATFNILHGRSPGDGVVDLDRYAAAVRRLDADVLALQEVDDDQARSHHADLTAVAAAAMGAVDHRFAATLVGTPDVWTAATGEEEPDTGRYGIALLSRFPVLAWRAVRLPQLDRPVPVRFPGHTNPVMVTDEPRVALVADVESPGGVLTVVGTHLTFIPSWNDRQLVRLARDVVVGLPADQGAPRPAVLMGDLNMHPPHPERLTRWTSLASGRTFPAEAPTEQLDHVIGRGPVRATGPARSLDLGLSDHRALVVDVAVG
ncbi:endonuclease/exonuclease/phosphatase family protein [Actinotalea sp. Marseille-Q4924]|uniref:endonuclease/exonuclease/phosphatase family protein n=1 Tax=Actinotalea sp. Marseille-Q4924 TaxID=2866571 RepID=UPI001CE3DE62|nr:endonuclease/exonuclease/phosphatase family protein [Actinotalea sp. Marseille-Q4924]